MSSSGLSTLSQQFDMSKLFGVNTKSNTQTIIASGGSQSYGGSGGDSGSSSGSGGSNG